MFQGKGKYQRAVLYVSGDALRVVDEISKVSLCCQCALIESTSLSTLPGVGWCKVMAVLRIER